MGEHWLEVATGNRFEFGKNWSRFLSVLTSERVAEAEISLIEMLGSDAFEGKSFLDIGSGSGLFSLAARRLGARVHSFDYDPESVACTKELKKRYFQDDDLWKIESGSALDTKYVASLGNFDIVYAWGVLHHTGALWDALANALLPVGHGGQLFVAVYNDQGLRSEFWLRVKKVYCSNWAGRALVTGVFIPLFLVYGLVSDVARLRNPIKRYSRSKKQRGMSVYYDWFDWLGGLPFEVARPDEIIQFYQERGFELSKLATTSSWGNNQFVFKCHRRCEPS